MKLAWPRGKEGIKRCTFPFPYLYKNEFAISTCVIHDITVLGFHLCICEFRVHYRMFLIPISHPQRVISKDGQFISLERKAINKSASDNRHFLDIF